MKVLTAEVENLLFLCLGILLGGGDSQIDRYGVRAHPRIWSGERERR
jgi:hypothetical protein